MRGAEKWNQLSGSASSTVSDKATVRAHVHVEVWLQWNAQFTFTGISEAFHCADFYKQRRARPLFCICSSKIYMSSSKCRQQSPFEHFPLLRGLKTQWAHIKPADLPPPCCTGATLKELSVKADWTPAVKEEKNPPFSALLSFIWSFKGWSDVLLHLMPGD